ncbi:TPA: DUF1947 domain-containing protein [Candidatus Woesearchaeota archaeon]|nr:hypothetical protein [uncultured archaeon]AQS32104.1 hypothetical protein [uncultured archaeon]MBS3115298.1 DUF1947 domain-containing protein [Candidatus Woesearchaeota archaeon]HIH39486.1 DUF1947 domain-containing protein [Candidatus Woesearchaeota archaeon]
MMKTLSKAEVKKLRDELWAIYKVDLFKKGDIIQLNTDTKSILVNKELYFFSYEDRYVPTLKLLQKINFLKKVTVDMGAVKFVVDGADIMRPGIVDVEEFNADDFVSVVDVNNKKPLAVGIALFNSKEIEAYKTGRVIKNIHYVGDEIWSNP